MRESRVVNQITTSQSRDTGNVCKLEPFNGLFILQELSYNSGTAQNKPNTPPKLCCSKSQT